MRTRGPETREPGAYTFHYDRGERLSSGGVDRDGAPREKGGLFKRNRSLAIVVIDLLVILLIYGLYILFFAPAGNTGTVAGNDLTLRAFSFDSELYITLRVEGPDPESADEESVEPVLSVVFAAGAESIVVQDTLPGSGADKTLRAILAAGGADRVTATVSVADETATFWAEVDAE